ncbi:MAG: ABC transporter ATP-binding protein [Lentisphaeraceae bacterium]|nr:ABC transporter ATP-binding protein [Lentisphaeraceae bacterium]
MSKVSFSGISKTYDGEVKAVDNLDLEITSGEMIVLVGPSGCGKTTTLRLLAGLEELTSGEIHINDRDVSREPPQKRNLGMVFQNYALYPHKTIYQNLAFGLKVRKVKSSEIKQLIDEVSEKLNIKELYKRYPSEISGGQKQRVALGRALLRGSDLILFDEPLSNLDASLRMKLRLEIAELHREKKFTGIFVTHDQTEATALGDRIAVMNKGKICQLATPQELYESPADTFVASFIGSPAMNLLSGEESKDLYSLLSKEQELARTVGFRPESISFESGENTFKATVLQSELQGADWLVYAKADDFNFCCRSKSEISSGEVLDFYVDSAKLHFFDSTGKCLK